MEPARTLHLVPQDEMSNDSIRCTPRAAADPAVTSCSTTAEASLTYPLSASHDVGALVFTHGGFCTPGAAHAPPFDLSAVPAASILTSRGISLAISLDDQHALHPPHQAGAVGHIDPDAPVGVAKGRAPSGILTQTREPGSHSPDCSTLPTTVAAHTAMTSRATSAATRPTPEAGPPAKVLISYTRR